MYYGPSQHQQFRIAVTTFENGGVETRFHGAVHMGNSDEVVIELTGVAGRFDDPQPAIREAAQRVRSGGIKWLRPAANDWTVDGDMLRGMTDDLGELNWLTGTAAITPRYDPQEMFRAGNYAATGRVLISFDEATWIRARQPWEKNWAVVDGEARAGGQGTVRRVQSRLNATQFGALKVLHGEHQQNRERRYRLLREVQALGYMDGNGTPRVYESNAAAYNDPQQILYCITEFIDGPTLSSPRNKRRFDIAAASVICERLADTLEALHCIGHKHRDLKPDNVILRNASPGDPILVDFGMASAADEDDKSFKTETNQEIGNRFLRLPEFSAGSHRDDPRSDITQLVALFFYMITGITPRQLVDSDGRRPHEREHPRFTSLRQQAQWPRLRALFDEGFAVQLDKRIPDLPTFRARLRSLNEPLADPETMHEIERFGRAAADPQLVSHAERCAELVVLSERFVTRVRDILHSANIEIETEDRLSPGGRHAEVIIAARPRGLMSPTVHVRHDLEFDENEWRGELHGDDGQPVKYLAMPRKADIKQINTAIDRGASRVVRNLVRYLNYELERVPELRRGTPGPRTQLTELRQKYPIGIDVQVQREEMHRRLALSFQNNSGVTQAKFSVLLLFPLALHATIEGILPTEQEKKYDRFTFEIAAPLADRATMTGPIVHLVGDPAAASTDSHILFQVKAEDSQFTMSIRIGDIRHLAHDPE